MFDKVLNTAMPLVLILKRAISFYSNPWNVSVEELIFSKIASTLQEMEIYPYTYAIIKV